MKTSKLSLKKIRNIDRQIKLYEKDIDRIVNRGDEAKLIEFKSGAGCTARDFYEYCIDNQPLINIISKAYWNVEANEDAEFFNTHIGCLGAFGSFWDNIYIKVFIQKEFTKNQNDTLFDAFKQNYNQHQNPIFEKDIKEEIVTNVVNDFLFYCCQDCGDAGCGGITLNIEKKEGKIFWTDNEKINIKFDSKDYEEVFNNYLKMNEMK